MYSLRLFHDHLPSGAKVQPIESQHAFYYVFKGAVEINGEKVEQDNAVYSMDIANIRSLEQDTTIWRFELVRTDSPLAYATGDGVCSELKIRRRVHMFELSPKTDWFYRLDSIYNRIGTTGLHSHPGCGIRCLLNGNLHVRGSIGENSDNVNPGDSWFEEGAYPIVSTTYDEIPTGFLRGMLLPVEYAQHRDTVIWLESVPNTGSSWKSYAQTIVRLL